eukprot:4911080-Pleurochrysis_carterae.AAC.2
MPHTEKPTTACDAIFNAFSATVFHGNGCYRAGKSIPPNGHSSYFADSKEVFSTEGYRPPVTAAVTT